ncbi:beta-xylosidase [Streptomyces sp. NPDC051940]|uniref:beta-xylosidase n=1 Tax=Streptomyces sp. NPDC051940 TaxID=3155675 RepID=UPI00342AA8B7
MGTNNKRFGRRRRSVALVGAAVLGVALGAVGPASAATPVTFTAHCIPPAVAGLPPIDGPTTAVVEVSDTTPNVGDTVTVTYKITQAAASNPTDIALPADVVTPTGKVVLTGAQSGTVNVAGPKSNPPIPGKAPFPEMTMTGTFTVTEPGAIELRPGDYNIHTSYILELDTPCTVLTPPAPVSETVTATGVAVRAIQLSAASGNMGAPVTVNGTNFTAGAAITIAGVAGQNPTGDVTTATADAGGAFSASLTVNALSTTGIIAFEGAAYDPATAAGPVPYDVVDTTPPPPGSQKLNTAVQAGTLSMTQSGDTVEMTSVPFGEGGNSTGALNSVTVKDYRGGTVGWSLTGTVTDFDGPGTASIPGSALSWTPSCATAAGSPSTCAAGSPGSIGSAGATLAGTPGGAVTGGEFTADAGLSLSVPRFSPTGDYSALLTLTLA